MSVYYNEIDRNAAAWLRELIKHGHIAHGVVDERSISDVKPNELVGFTQCHFFAGIGGMEPRPAKGRMARRSASMDGILPMPTFQRGRR
jgi:hypothetical protein